MLVCRAFFIGSVVFAVSYGNLVVDRKREDEVLNTSSKPEGCTIYVGRPIENTVSCKCGPDENTVAANPGQEAKCLALSALGCNTVFSVQMSGGSLRVPSIHGCDTLKDVFIWNVDSNNNKAVWTNINGKATQLINGKDVNIGKYKGHLLKMVSSCDPTKCAILKVGGGMVTYPFDMEKLDQEPAEPDHQGTSSVKISFGGGITSNIGGGFATFGSNFGTGLGDLFTGLGDWLKDFKFKK